MKTSNHTPGPWLVDRLTNRGPVRGQYSWWIQNMEGEEGERIAIVESAWTPEKEDPASEANARLIASAPDLLAALEKAATLIEKKFAQMGMDYTEEDQQAHAECVSTIAQAKGETK